MLRVISAALAVAFLLGVAPTVADLDAHSRATGNRKDVATSVGERIFAKTWSAQVLQVEANGLDAHLVLGLHVSGVKFHDPMTRPQFEAEIRNLVAEAFKAEPSAEEVDVWVTVPIDVGKGVIVSGDLAKPTTRTVYSTSELRGSRSAGNVFVDEDWAHSAFKSKR